MATPTTLIQNPHPFPCGLQSEARPNFSAVYRCFSRTCREASVDESVAANPRFGLRPREVRRTIKQNVKDVGQGAGSFLSAHPVKDLKPELADVNDKGLERGFRQRHGE